MKVNYSFFWNVKLQKKEHLFVYEGWIRTIFLTDGSDFLKVGLDPVLGQHIPRSDNHTLIYHYNISIMLAFISKEKM